MIKEEVILPALDDDEVRADRAELVCEVLVEACTKRDVGNDAATPIMIPRAVSANRVLALVMLPIAIRTDCTGFIIVNQLLIDWILVLSSLSVVDACANNDYQKQCCTGHDGAGSTRRNRRLDLDYPVVEYRLVPVVAVLVLYIEVEIARTYLRCILIIRTTLTRTVSTSQSNSIVKSSSGSIVPIKYSAGVNVMPYARGSMLTDVNVLECVFATSNSILPASPVSFSGLDGMILIPAVSTLIGTFHFALYVWELPVSASCRCPASQSTSSPTITLNERSIASPSPRTPIFQ